MGVELPDDGVSFRVNLCAVEELGGRLVIRSHNGGNIHGDEALTLMRDLLADPAFAEKLAQTRMTIYPTDTFRHIGVARGTFADLAAARFTEPHNVLEQFVEPHLPALSRPTNDQATRRLCAQIAELMKLSYQALDDHPINRARRANGRLPANMIWPWGAATPMRLDSFERKYHKRGAVISAVPLVWGIAGLMGLPAPKVPGANGDLDTNYEGKAQAALDALLIDGLDFAAVHVEAPDEMAHAGSLEKKLHAIENLDRRVVGPIATRLTESGEPFRLLLLSDHPTLLTTRTHDGSPVPYALYDSRRPGTPRKFCERACAAENAPVVPGTTLLSRLFEQE